VFSETDLHIHSTFSDGVMSPAELVMAAEQIRLRNIAITDHDSVDGVPLAVAAGYKRSINVMPGLELSVDWRGSSIDLLGYAVDVSHQALVHELNERHLKRLERVRKTLDILAKEGVQLDWDDVAAIGGEGAIGRPHIAWAMMRKGYVASVEEAFSIYLGQDCAANVPSDAKLSLPDGIALIHKAKGVAIIAHPYMPEFPEYLDINEILPEALDAGIDGIEAYYTGYTVERTAQLVDLAKRYDLIVTGGSDFHGGNQLPHCKLGAVNVPSECVAAIWDRSSMGKPESDAF
jgi:predicted metal-dependent phosphoesterase TrpH